MFGLPITLTIKDYVIAALAAALLALLVACFVAIHLPFGINIEGFKPRADRLATELATANDRLSVSNASIIELQTDLAAKNAESEARAKAYQNSQKLAAEDAQRLTKQAQASEGQIARLRALAASEDKSGCTVPKELSDALSGL